ncbi:MAG TPA: glycosyltransferase family 4 protein, partial [Candidatus Binataceae bacterium]|nr:glycosyltransferase family 4 protein [Candidatus Binataceae bacterium]
SSEPPRIWPLIEYERSGAIKVIRTFAPNIAKSRSTLRYLDLIIYFMLAGYAALRERADVVITETDPPLLGLLGAMMKWLWRCPFVYYCQDIYPDVAAASGALRSRPLLWLLGWANKCAYRKADAIIALASDMAGLLRRKGIAADKIVIIPNWTDCGKVQPQLSSGRDAFVAMYAGNIGWTQNLESVLDTAQLLRHEPRVRFAIVGDGARKAHLQTRAMLMQLDNVEFIDRVATEKLSEVLADCDLHLIPLQAGVAGCMVPSKVYGILAAGKPFVAMMEREAEVARIAIESRVGFVVAPGDAAGLARIIREAASNRGALDAMGVRARALAERSFDRRIATRRFGALIAAVQNGAALSEPEEIETTPALEIDTDTALAAK